MKNIKALLREFVGEVLAVTKVSSFSKTPKNSLSILTFHRVLPEGYKKDYPYPQLVATPEELEWILSALKPHFQVESVSDACISINNETSKKPLLSITFDDGQLDNLVYGAPVLNKLNVPATFYIPTSYIGSNNLLWHDIAGFAWQAMDESRKKGKILTETNDKISNFFSLKSYLDYLKSLNHEQRVDEIIAAKKLVPCFPEWARMLTWSEVKKIHQLGFEIGSHAATHELLADLPASKQRAEIYDSYNEIVFHTGTTPKSFCYPNGDYNDDTLQLIQDSKYVSAVTTNWGNNFSKTNNFQLNRYDMDTSFLRNINSELSMSRLQFRLSRFQPKIT